MSDKTRQRFEVAIFALVFGGGAGWGTFQYQLSTFNARLTAIEGRVTDIYCATVPVEKQRGCR